MGWEGSLRGADRRVGGCTSLRLDLFRLYASASFLCFQIVCAEIGGDRGVRCLRTRVAVLPVFHVSAID